MKPMGSLDFGTVIAYLLPGFLVFYALHYISPDADQLFSLSLSKDGGFGVEISIALFALLAGIVVSAFRANVLDNIQEWSGVNKPDYDFSKLKDPNVLKAFETAIANTYRFAQFYGNAFIALLSLAAARVWAIGIIDMCTPLFIIIVVSLVLLFVAHRKQLAQTYTTIDNILS